MPAEPFTLFPPDADGGPWRAGTDGPTLAEGPDARAALDGVGHAGQPVALALPSRWCLCAAIETAGLPKKNRRQTMAYRLEEKLPLAAEEVVADFIPGPADAAFGVCAAVATVGPVIAALEDDAIPVRHVCPAALLAARNLIEASDGDAALLWQSAGGIDLIRSAAGRPTRWLALPADPAAVALHLGLMADQLDAPLAVRTEAVDPATLAELEKDDRLKLESPGDRSLFAAAAEAGAAALAGRAPWVDLRRDALAAPDPYDRLRPPLTAALVAAAALMLAFCGATLWRAQQNGRFVRQYEADEAAVFREVFPKSPVPVAAAIPRRLEIEQRRVSGPTAAVDGDAPSALRLLNDALSRLPADVRYRLVELRLTPTELFLDGQTRTHGDAATLAAALQKMPYYDVGPPGTERIESADEPAVTFRITGSHAAPKPERGPK